MNLIGMYIERDCNKMAISYNVFEMFKKDTCLIPCYFRYEDGKLGCTVVDTDDHEEAILMTHTNLLESGISIPAPILALIHGGKRAT